MKKYVLLGYCLVCSTMLLCQTLTIIHKDSAMPIIGATLLSSSPQVTAVTNANGQVDISAFAKSDKIEIRSLGFQSIIASYTELQRLDYKLQMEPANFNLENVVVSATRWRQSSAKVPSKIISIRPEEIALQNPQTAADLLGNSGKVFIQKSQQGGGSPMIRGFATNRLIYVVDGVRMNTAIFRGGNLQNVINLDPFATERAEVLFGPGSVIYGSDAIGGVMNFQTLRPQLSLSGETHVSGKAVLRYASANQEKTGHFDLNVGWNKWALVTSFSAWDYDHLRQGRFGPDDYLKDYFIQRQNDNDVTINQEDPLLQIPSAYAQQNVMQKVRFQPNEHWNLEYAFHYSTTSPYGRYDRHNRIRNGAPRYGEWNYGPQQWMMNQLSVDHQSELAAYDQLSIRLAHQAFGESRISRNLHATTREVREEMVTAYSANLDFTKALDSSHTLYYGVEWVQNDVRSLGFDENIITDERADGPDRYPQADWRTMAVYVNDDYQLSPQWHIQAGLRYTQFMLDADFRSNLDFYPFPFEEARINDGAFSGSVGTVWRPNDSWVIQANAGTAFRAPNVDDIGKVFDSEPGTVTVPNPNLKAEYAYNLDLGFTKVFGNRLKLELTGFYTQLQNALVRRNYQLNGQDSITYDGVLSQVQAIQNAAKANVYGLQAGLEVKLPAGFRFSSDWNVQIGEEELDDGTTSPSRHAAPAFGVSRIHFETDRLQLQCYAIYQAEQSHENLAESEKGKDEIYALDADGNTYAPAWYTLNIKAMYRLNETFRLSTGLENLTDQRYRPYSSGISGGGRNFIMSLTAIF